MNNLTVVQQYGRLQRFDTTVDSMAGITNVRLVVPKGLSLVVIKHIFLLKVRKLCIYYTNCRHACIILKVVGENSTHPTVLSRDCL